MGVRRRERTAVGRRSLLLGLRGRPALAAAAAREHQHGKAECSSPPHREERNRPLHGPAMLAPSRRERENRGMEHGPIRYAKSGDVNIAYQVTGAGPFDL